MKIDEITKIDLTIDKILSYTPKAVAEPPEAKTLEKGRKRLNDLTGKEWVKGTKSVWLEDSDKQYMQTVEEAMKSGVLLSESPPRDDLKKNIRPRFLRKT